MAMNGVDYVIHGAALKQVPGRVQPNGICKNKYLWCRKYNSSFNKSKSKKNYCFIYRQSANPINLYGATKLASDKIFTAANNIVGSQKTIFSVVRYGNVAGSRGSVVPYFKELIDKKIDYLPITHNDMTRFWITLDQAVDFVLMSFERMIGGEIFVPKIPSIKILTWPKPWLQI